MPPLAAYLETCAARMVVVVVFVAVVVVDVILFRWLFQRAGRDASEGAWRRAGRADSAGARDSNPLRWRRFIELNEPKPNEERRETDARAFDCDHQLTGERNLSANCMIRESRETRPSSARLSVQTEAPAEEARPLGGHLAPELAPERRGSQISRVAGRLCWGFPARGSCTRGGRLSSWRREPANLRDLGGRERADRAPEERSLSRARSHNNRTNRGRNPRA